MQRLGEQSGEELPRERCGDSWVFPSEEGEYSSNALRRAEYIGLLDLE